MTNVADLTNSIRLSNLTSKSLLGATFAQAVYPNVGGVPFKSPSGFDEVKLPVSAFNQLSSGFNAQAYFNVQTGELVIAYQGSDGGGEAINAASWASTGTWHPQFTDATNFAAAARAAALAKVNEYRKAQEQTTGSSQPQLDKFPNDKILVTGHSLGGLLGQVVSKMFGWSARVKGGIAALLALSISAAVHAQDPGKHALDYTYAEGSPQYWRGMHSTRPGNFVFRKDPHVWVVTPDFAKKAGLPLEWASDELQGVTAAAWRMQPGEEQCGWGGNPKACKRDMVCTLDLYFDRQTQALPWAPNRPVADFYWQDVSSAWHLLPSLGFAQEANGDLGRGSKGSPNYPSLHTSPFADPKTGEELVWNARVIAYDREMHARYAFVRLELGCLGFLGAEPHKDRKFNLETKESRSERYANMDRSTDRPDLARFVHHTVSLPASWDRRIGPQRKAFVDGTTDFYQNTWKQLNK